ncbi:C40 family peptidase [Rathayibacter sp. CAU 1779]
MPTALPTPTPTPAPTVQPTPAPTAAQIRTPALAPAPAPAVLPSRRALREAARAAAESAESSAPATPLAGSAAPLAGSAAASRTEGDGTSARDGDANLPPVGQPISERPVDFDQVLGLGAEVGAGGSPADHLTDPRPSARPTAFAASQGFSDAREQLAQRGSGDVARPARTDQWKRDRSARAAHPVDDEQPAAGLAEQVDRVEGSGGGASAAGVHGFRPRNNAVGDQPGGRMPGAPAHRARSSRRSAAIAGGAVLALIPGLMFAAPANAAETLTPDQLQATIASNSKLIAQKLQVSASVNGSSLQTENYVAGAIAGIVAAESGPNGAEVAIALAEALQHGGAREAIVETALTYLGDPYELGGSSHDGIDCSGLTMVSYAAAGISLAHYVPSQDAVATTIAETDAQPGDLVFFNDEEHVAIYLGGGMIIEAPDYGIPVRIVSLSTWSGIGYHFGRILPN